ncbi:MAG TPA: alanine--glyoxylate aminotransferase family protein [Methylomirabilota bacterium]|nr:alanine--glyoxylate aminotransferase family protein [Methylomirabilota bacterium]
MLKRYLLTPGPTAVPPEVMLRMSQPLIHHRTPEFEKLFAEVQEGLRWLFQTEQDVLMLAASGTGAMEAAVSNLCSAGDTVIVVNGGKFGERWLKISQAFGLRPVELKVEWGQAVRTAAIAEALKANPHAKAILVQASETSTTALHPIKDIADLTKNSDTLLVVDGITSVGAAPTPMDQWGLDVVITGSQKALMLPPGLAFIALSERAWKKVESATLPRYYFDLKRERKEQQKHTTAYTPAISLINGLAEVLHMMKTEGLEHIFARHARLAAATRAAAQALGLALLAPASPSPAATGVFLPEGMNGGQFLKYMRDRMGVDIAGGQDHLKGKIMRISHIGYAGPFDVITAISSVEMALRRFGYAVELGRGVRTAEEILMEGWPAVG